MKQLTRATVVGILTASLTLVGLAVTGCDWDDHAGEYRSVERTFTGFDRVKVNGRTDVTVQEGARQTVTLRGGEHTLEKAKTSVAGGILTIDRIGRAGRALDVTIMVPKLRGVSVDGTGTVKLIDINADTLELSNGGAGTLTARGRADRLTATLSGVGELELANLVAKTADVKVNGVGHAEVRVTDDLTATVNGVGGIEYHGDPKVHPTLNGVGSIRRA